MTNTPTNADSTADSSAADTLPSRDNDVAQNPVRSHLAALWHAYQLAHGQPEHSFEGLDPLIREAAEKALCEGNYRAAHDLAKVVRGEILAPYYLESDDENTYQRLHDAFHAIIARAVH